MAGELRIGIMGGTFDPIHYGHLATAEEAKYRFQLDKVIFIPCGQPPHKKTYQVSGAEHRFKMTHLAIEDNPAFHISRLEIDRPGPSYSIDTVEELCRLYPDARLHFITGADAILEILTWREPRRLAEMCQLIAATRPGHDLTRFHQQVGEDIAPRVHLLAVPGVNISSTEIRQRTAEGAPIRYLLPESVRDYIQRVGLYR